MRDQRVADAWWPIRALDIRKAAAKGRRVHRPIPNAKSLAKLAGIDVVRQRVATVEMP